MTGFVQVKSGKYYAVLNLYDENGKRKPKWISTGLPERGNKRKAEAMLKEIIARYEKTGELPIGRGHSYEKVANGLPVGRSVTVLKADMLLIDYLQEWLYLHKSTIQAATYNSYSNMISGRIDKHFRPLGLYLKEITPQIIEQFEEEILLEGYTTNTAIHYHAVLRKAFQDAVKKDYLPKNPFDKVDRPRKNTFHPKFYSQEEVQLLLETAKNDPLHLCIMIAAYYGLRRSEVLGLTWSSIDFVDKKIVIERKVTEQQVNGKFIPIVSNVMKNKSSYRTMPLIPAVEQELIHQKERQKMLRNLLGNQYNDQYLDYVCTDQMGRLFRPNFVTEHFENLLKHYNLKRIRFHDLRHTCASLMLANGVPMKQIQEWLGHSTFSTTADIYAHLEYKSKLQSAQTISSVLEMPAPPENGADKVPDVEQ
ncbi:MAG: site-specific integrase [Faecalibacterium sp.]|jgi:integrase|nr:site-specific integrase [Faecalibacterium sp.]